MIIISQQSLIKSIIKHMLFHNKRNTTNYKRIPRSATLFIKLERNQRFKQMKARTSCLLERKLNESM